MGEEGAVSGGLGDAEHSLSISLWFTQLFHVVSSESFTVIRCAHCGSIAPPVQVDRSRSSKRCCVGRDSSTWLNPIVWGYVGLHINLGFCLIWTSD